MSEINHEKISLAECCQLICESCRDGIPFCGIDPFHKSRYPDSGAVLGSPCKAWPLRRKKQYYEVEQTAALCEPTVAAATRHSGTTGDSLPVDSTD